MDATEQKSLYENLDTIAAQLKVTELLSEVLLTVTGIKISAAGAIEYSDLDVARDSRTVVFRWLRDHGHTTKSGSLWANRNVDLR